MNLMEEVMLAGAVAGSRRGLTMLIDKGLGLGAVQDLLEISGRYVDHAKIAFGSMLLYDRETISRKISLYRQHNITVYPGGTAFEWAFDRGCIEEYFNLTASLGLTHVEISSSNPLIDRSVKAMSIRLAVRCGLTVISEVGSKDPGKQPSPEQILEDIKADLGSGADKVIIESRESGVGVGLYDGKGELKRREFDKLRESIDRMIAQIIIEAPLKNQQAGMIRAFGPEVSLGNIAPADLISLECLRQGLRWDTMAANAQEKKNFPIAG